MQCGLLWIWCDDMPHVKWCQFTGIPSLNPRFVNLLKEICLEHPKYAFFIDFDYERNWEQIKELLSLLNIDEEHAFFAIRSMNNCPPATRDTFKGIVSRHSSLTDEQIITVNESVADYYSFISGKLVRDFSAGNTSIHRIYETDDLFAIHMNTIIKDTDDKCFVDAEHIDKLLCNNYPVDKAVIAFGCGDSADFVDKELFATMCSMYKANIYMCSSNDSRVDKIVNNEIVWKVGICKGTSSFNVCCVDTDLNYRYVKRYSKQEDLSWGIDRELGIYKYQTRNTDHYGKHYLLDGVLEINQLHNLALKELVNGLEVFLAADDELLEWVIFTYQYSHPLDFTLEFYIGKHMETKYDTWDFRRYEYLKLEPGEYVKCNDKNILLTCHIENLDVCREWVDQIAWKIIKRKKLKIRIVVIGNNAKLKNKEIKNMVYIPLDIYHELQLPKLPISAENHHEKQLSTAIKSEDTQLKLGIIWEHISLRKQLDQEKNFLKYIMAINSIYKVFEALSVNEQSRLLQMFKGKEEETHDSNKENEIVVREERDNSHDQ